MPDGSQTLDAAVLESTAVPPTAAPSPRNRKRKLGLIALAGTVKVAALGVGAYWALVGANTVSTDNAYVGASSAQINSQVVGPVAEVHASDAQTVHRGDVLMKIDPADATLALSKAEADYRRATQRVLQYYAQEAGAVAQVNVRRAELEKADAHFKRRQALLVTENVSKEDYVASQTAFLAAKSNLVAAEQQLEAQRALTRGTTPEDHPETLAAAAAYETAKLNVERTVIRAPIDGIVAQRKVQVGQQVQPGQQLMTVTPLADTYVDANFKENQLGKVRPGQTVTLTSDLYGDDIVFHGKVAGLGGGTGSAFAIIPAQNATGNWIKVVQRLPVRITLDPAELAAHPLRVGLSMNAEIDVRHQGT
jgi:membrane fusion protein (multidrug efflux system)